MVISWREVPMWVWVAATLGWCGAALGVSYKAAKQGGGGGAGGGKGRKILKLAVAGPFMLLPFMLLSGLLPWANARAALIFTLGWVTPCKLLLLWWADFSIDCPSWSLSHFSHFLLAFLLPVRIIKAMEAGGCLHTAQLSSTIFVELSALLLCYSIYESLHPSFTYLAHILALYLLLDLPHRLASIMLLTLFGVQTHPIFCKPWLSTSLTDFWGRRWDLTANALLRHTVYNPVVNLLTAASSSLPAQYCNEEKQDLSSAKGRKPLSCSLSMSADTSLQLPLLVRLAGVNMTFFVSGLIHELLFFSLTQAVVPTWEVTTFFIVHGIATSAEIILRRVCPTHIIFKMPTPLKIVFTMCFMYATMACLFFPQPMRARFLLDCILEYRDIKESMRFHASNHNPLDHN